MATKTPCANPCLSKDTPFTYTAPSDVGTNRNTMLQNELLLRSKLGVSKTRGFRLPGGGYIYGLPNEKREYTASDALHGWPGLLQPRKEDKTKLERDYITLNRAAVASGMVNSREYTNFRALHDAVRRIPSDTKTNAKTLRTIDPNWVFGIPSRPSTPIFDILEHKYQKEWVGEQREIENQRRMRLRIQAGKRSNPGPVYENRATLLRTYQEPVEAPPLWQMPRFTKSAKPHLQTFRTTDEKRGAEDNFEMDKTSRRGVFGTGVYRNAQDAVNFKC